MSPFRLSSCVTIIGPIPYLYFTSLLHCKKGSATFPSPAGVSDIPAGDRTIANLFFYSVSQCHHFVFCINVYLAKGWVALFGLIRRGRSDRGRGGHDWSTYGLVLECAKFPAKLLGFVPQTSAWGGGVWHEKGSSSMAKKCFFFLNVQKFL